jgi:hypothetical protein
MPERDIAHSTPKHKNYTVLVEVGAKGKADKRVWQRLGMRRREGEKVQAQGKYVVVPQVAWYQCETQ